MQTITLERLLSIRDAHGIHSVTLEKEGSFFLLKILIKHEGEVFLAKPGVHRPHRFDDPLPAKDLLEEFGILIDNFEDGDVVNDNSDDEEFSAADFDMDEHPSHSSSIAAEEKSAYNEWLRNEIRHSASDCRSNLSNDEVMAEMEGEISKLQVVEP